MSLLTLCTRCVYSIVMSTYKKESSKKKKYTSEKSRESSPSQNNNVVLDDYPFKHEKRNKLMKDISCNRDKSIKDLPKSKLSKDEKYLNYEKSFFFEKGSFQKNRSKKFLQDNRNKDFFGKRDSSYNRILQSREKTKRSESRGIGGNISNSMLIANKMPQEKSTSFYKNQSKDNLNNSNSDIDNSEYKFLSECKNSKHDKFKYIGRSTPQSRNDKLIDTYWDKKYRLPDHDNKKLNLSTSPISENRAYKDNKHSDFENRLSKNTKYTYDKNSSASRHNSVKFSYKSYHDIETTKNASKDVITVFQTSNVKVTHCSRKNNYEKEIKSKNKEQNYNDEQSKKRNEKKSPNSIKDKTSKKSLTPDFKSGLTSSYIHKSKSPVEKKLKKRDIDKQVKYNKPLPVVRLRASSSETGISDSEFDKEKEDDGDDKMLKLLKTDLAAKAKESLERKKEKPNPQYPMKEIIQPDIFDIKISPMKTGKDNLQGDFKNGFDIKSNRDIYKVQANLKIRSKSQSKSSCQSSTSSNGSCRSKSHSYSSHSLSRSRTVSRSNTRSSSTSSSTQSSSTAHSRSPSIPRRHGSPSFLDRRRITR